MQDSQGGLKSRFEQTGEGLRDPEGGTIDVMESEGQKAKRTEEK